MLELWLVTVGAAALTAGWGVWALAVAFLGDRPRVKALFARRPNLEPVLFFIGAFGVSWALLYFYVRVVVAALPY